MSNLAFKVTKKINQAKIDLFLKDFYRIMQKLNPKNKIDTLKWMEDYIIWILRQAALKLMFVCFKAKIEPFPGESNPYFQSSPGY